MRLGVLFSGGKDSSLALFRAIESRSHEVACLISIVSENPESYMFHTPNIHLAKTQAEAIGIPLLQKTTKGIKEEELEQLKEAILEARQKYDVQGIVTGAIRSTYQASRVQKICYELGLWCFNPLWLKDQLCLLNEIVEKKFYAIISGIFAYPLKKELLGKKIDKTLIKRLQSYSQIHGISPSGEGGEIETTVLDAPFFKKRIEIIAQEVDFQKNSGIFRIKEFRLVEK